jgi:hypothetical protein
MKGEKLMSRHHASFCDTHSYQSNHHVEGHFTWFSPFFDFNWGHHTGSDSSVLTGTAGGSVNLSVENSTLSLIGDGSVTQDGVTLTHSTSWCGYSSTTVSVAEWNQSGYKEAQIINSDDSITVNDVVDVNIVNSNSCGVDIDINNCKRGVIDTASGNDNIDISVYSNLVNWTNYYSINTGSGDDSLTMHDVQKSYLTSFDIDMGNGNDTVDISDMLNPNSDSVSRVIDGGNGLDTLIFNGESALDFKNFEVVIADSADSDITIDSDLLSDNGASWHGLVLSGLDLNFSDDVSISSSDDISWHDYFYLKSLDLDAHDFVSVTVDCDDGSYHHILTDDVDAVLS